MRMWLSQRDCQADYCERPALPPMTFRILFWGHLANTGQGSDAAWAARTQLMRLPGCALLLTYLKLPTPHLSGQYKGRCMVTTTYLAERL